MTSIKPTTGGVSSCMLSFVVTLSFGRSRTNVTTCKSRSVVLRNAPQIAAIASTTSITRHDSPEAGFQYIARTLRVLGLVEQVRVDLERDVRRRVAQLPRDVDDVESFSDEKARVRSGDAWTCSSPSECSNNVSMKWRKKIAQTPTERRDD